MSDAPTKVQLLEALMRWSKPCGALRCQALERLIWATDRLVALRDEFDRTERDPLMLLYGGRDTRPVEVRRAEYVARRWRRMIGR